MLEPDLEELEAAPDAHGMDPARVLALARSLGGPLPRTLVVGCEPEVVMDQDSEEVIAELSEPVIAALDEAVRLVESLVDDLTSTQTQEVSNE